MTGQNRDFVLPKIGTPYFFTRFVFMCNVTVHTLDSADQENVNEVCVCVCVCDRRFSIRGRK